MYKKLVASMKDFIGVYTITFTIKEPQNINFQGKFFVICNHFEINCSTLPNFLNFSTYSKS